MAYRRREGETAHQARERIAREKGFRSYRDYRQRSAQERQNATAALVRRRGDRSTYGRGAKGADLTIRNRARQRIETAGGETIYTTRNPRRLAPAIAAADPTAPVRFRVVVRVEDVDRRRRDPRRRRGRDSGFRNLEWQTPAGRIPSDPAAFARWLDAEIGRQMNRRYPGGFAVDTITVVVPPAVRRGRRRAA